MKYAIYRKYIDNLMKNQNNTTIPCLQDIYTKKNYENLLNPVMRVIKENPHASLTTLRLKLFLQSGLKEIIDNFVKQTKITPGITSTEPVMMVPNELGKMCLNMMLQSLAPSVLAARTYSWFLNL